MFYSALLSVLAGAGVLLFNGVPAPRSAPSKDLVETAQEAGSFKTLLAAAQAANLVDVLKGPVPLTVFAPTDEAFEALPAGVVASLLKPENRDSLATLLQYHVVPGRVRASQASKLSEATTVNDLTLRIRQDGGSLRVNDARVIKADISASNGVIHVIDQVLVPVGLLDKTPGGNAKELIVLAIKRGVPLFNAGDVAGCAAVYEVTATALLQMDGKEFSSQARSRVEKALRTIEKSRSARANAWTLRYALDAAYRSLASKEQSSEAKARAPKEASASRPSSSSCLVRATGRVAAADYIQEAKLPAGFPAPSAEGEIVVKEYPAYRSAAVRGDRGAFMTLFGHIKRNKIAMTAPVESGLSESGARTSMAFLYERPNMGNIGKDGRSVEVLDQPAGRFISIGIRGSASKEALASAVSKLQSWAGSRSELQVTGEPRLLSYNSPFVPASRRFHEVQMPVRATK